MLRREKIVDSTDVPMEFLGDEWDAALLGVAECGDPDMKSRPCYGYQAMKAIMRDTSTPPAVIYAKLQQAINRQMYSMTTMPLLLVKLNRNALWKTINAHKFPRWEQLDRGIAGIGRIGWEMTGVVYSKPLCVSILLSNQASPVENELQEAGQVAAMMDSSIIAVGLGEYSPWYLTPVI